MRLILKVLAALAVMAAGPASANAAPVDTGHIRAELVARSAAAPGQVLYVALVQDLDAGWHSYWRNPGDAGEPPRVAWTLPLGWTAGDIVWAAPRRLPLKSLMDYGYTGRVVLPIPIAVPASATPGQTVTLKAAVTVLVCEALCVPERAVLTLPVQVQAGSPLPSPRSAGLIDQALAAAPRPAGIKARFSVRGDVVTLTAAGAALKGADPSRAYFYPYASAVIAHAAPQTAARRPGGLAFTLAAGEDFKRGRGPATLAGVIALGDRAYEVTATRALK